MGADLRFGGGAGAGEASLAKERQSPSRLRIVGRIKCRAAIRTRTARIGETRQSRTAQAPGAPE